MEASDAARLGIKDLVLRAIGPQGARLATAEATMLLTCDQHALPQGSMICANLSSAARSSASSCSVADSCPCSPCGWWTPLCKSAPEASGALSCTIGCTSRQWVALGRGSEE